jgi:PTH1 family peptidyl-tRNA hydrolase
MNLIIWLWNPWDKYLKTKHNAGFLFLDYLIRKEQFTNFKLESKFKWEISNWEIEWKKIILLKPNTFMNLSWESLKKVIDFYKIDINNIIVIYDDLSIDLWKIRYRDKWSAGWHNWVKDIIKYFWDNFKRIKIWIWFNENYEVPDWVLSNFKDEEINELNENIFPKVKELLEKSI